MSAPHPANPCTGATLRGTFGQAASGRNWQVDGFCDDENGNVYWIRFMPPLPGDYSYSVDDRSPFTGAVSWGLVESRYGRKNSPTLIDVDASSWTSPAAAGSNDGRFFS